MANSVTARFNDDCKVFVSMSDDTTVEKAVIIDAEGNETDIGGGGGESDFSTATVKINASESIVADGQPLFISNLSDNKLRDYVIMDSPVITLTAVLYKGSLSIINNNLDFTNITGDMSADPSDPFYKITGNCEFSVDYAY